MSLRDELLAAQPVNRGFLGSNVLNYPVTATIVKFGIVPNEMTVHLQHNWLPQQIAPDGTTQIATLNLILKINGAWYTSAAERLRPGQENGVKRVAEPQYGGLSTVVGEGWFYDGSWEPMFGHNPVEGEPVGVFFTAGNTRVGAPMSEVRERSNILMVRWPSSAGSNPMFTLWDERTDGNVQPTPTPDPHQPPVEVSSDMSLVLAALSELSSQVTSLKADVSLLLHRPYPDYEGAVTGILPLPNFLGGNRPLNLKFRNEPL